MILKNVSLVNYNTMRIDVKAKNLLIIKTKDDLEKYLKESANDEILILGGGSNILFTKDFDGLVIKNEILGINVVEETQDYVKIKVGAGENWNDFVELSISKNWSGLENLILIPGLVGASPVQNIGAYGQEVRDRIVHVEAFDISSSGFINFSNDDCHFSYRDSIFKRKLKNKVIITSVTFELKKNFIPNLTFPSVVDSLSEKKINSPTIREIADTIAELRRKKLPDVKELGNCGSFFMNPILNKDSFDEFIKLNPNAPYYAQENEFKLSAGWLIEKCGWKGKSVGSVGTFKNHSLVIVNNGDAKGSDVLKFANSIKEAVYKKFNVSLEFEVNIF